MNQISIKPVFLYKYVNQYPCLFLLKGAALFGYKVAIDGVSGAHHWVEKYLSKGSINIDNFIPGADKFVGYYWDTAGQTLPCICLMDKIATATFWYVKGASFQEAKQIANEYVCEEWEAPHKPKPKPYYPPHSPNYPSYIPIPIPIPWHDHKPKPYKPKPYKPKPWHDHKPKPYNPLPWHDQDHKPKPWHEYIRPDDGLIPGLIPPHSNTPRTKMDLYDLFDL